MGEARASQCWLSSAGIAYTVDGEAVAVAVLDAAVSGGGVRAMSNDKPLLRLRTTEQHPHQPSSTHTTI